MTEKRRSDPEVEMSGSVAEATREDEEPKAVVDVAHDAKRRALVLSITPVVVDLGRYRKFPMDAIF